MPIRKSSLAALALLAPVLTPWSSDRSITASPQSPAASAETHQTTKKSAMLVQFLEIVTSDVDTTCKALEKVHGVTFGKPVAELGNARTTALQSGGRISVRAPLSEGDMTIVRPYMLVGDIEAAIQSADDAGAEFLMRTTEIPAQGKFAIYSLAGTQFGLWEMPPPK